MRLQLVLNVLANHEPLTMPHEPELTINLPLLFLLKQGPLFT